jgi:hypothetical protein
VHRTLPVPIADGYGAGWHTHLDQLDAVIVAAPVPDWGERFAALLPEYRP